MRCAPRCVCGASIWLLVVNVLVRRLVKSSENCATGRTKLSAERPYVTALLHWNPRDLGWSPGQPLPVFTGAYSAQMPKRKIMAVLETKRVVSLLLTPTFVVQYPPCIDVSSADDINSRFCCLYFCWACIDQVSHKDYMFGIPCFYGSIRLKWRAKVALSRF
jgi:hypothetical protein